MKLEYIKTDPTSNITVLVRTPVERAKQPEAAEKIMAADRQCEQVGFIEESESGPRLQMMGGEFCGNASRSAAAWALACDGGTQGVYDVSCSGCDTVLPAKVAQKGDGLYEAFIEMPYPEDVSGVLVDAGDVPARFFRVDLPGITHFVHFVPDLEGIDKEKYWHILADYVDGEDFPAYGLILCDTKEQTMIPAVYVRDTDTLYWENSCGSGSAAVAAALACTTHKNVACYMKQPGGTLAIAAKVGEQGELQQIFIGGPDKLSQVRKATI